MQSKYYPIEAFLACLKGKYKIPLLIYLKHGPKRYTQVRKKFPQCSERILIKQLKELVNEKIVDKTITGKKAPLTTNYCLSEYGFSLCNIIQDMWEWGEAHHKNKSLSFSKN